MLRINRYNRAFFLPVNKIFSKMKGNHSLSKVCPFSDLLSVSSPFTEVCSSCIVGSCGNNWSAEQYFPIICIGL